MSPSEAVEKYGKLIYYVLKKRGLYPGCNDYYEDLVQDGYEQLFICCKSYKESMGIKFSSYFSTSWHYKSMSMQAFYTARGLTGGVKRDIQEGKIERVKNILDMVYVDAVFENDKGETGSTQDHVGYDDEGYEFVEFCSVLNNISDKYREGTTKVVADYYINCLKQGYVPRQKEMAGALNISQSYVSRILRKIDKDIILALK